MQSDCSQWIRKFNMFIRGPVLAWISRGLHENSYQVPFGQTRVEFQIQSSELLTDTQRDELNVP
jgi:hypothetical protein